MTLDPVREKLGGVPNSHDRLWKIEVCDGVEALTDYNWEITGFTEGLTQLPELGKLVHYSGNAYHLLGELQKRGFTVTFIEDRR